VPAYENDDLHDDRYFAGRKSEKKKLEMIDQIKADKDEVIPKTFAHIAIKALNFTDKPDRFKGIEALGILKADVDNLGLLFACGMRKERLTLSRLATMSRQMNNYFSIFLPYKLKTDERFKNIYTVFAGGDDLFLIGAWNRIIDFAGFLNDSFKEYACRNEQITISAGVTLHKPNDPVLTLAETSEHALMSSKSNNKDSITIFGTTAKWTDLVELERIQNTIQSWLDSEMINNAMIFRLNELIEMRKQEEEIIKIGSVYLEDMECLKWRSRLKYAIVRNIGRKFDDKQKTIDDAMKVADWLETYKGALKIPLWQIIYNRR
jgi:CRISPR-associated protein Csm1